MIFQCTVFVPPSSQQMIGTFRNAPNKNKRNTNSEVLGNELLKNPKSNLYLFRKAEDTFRSNLREAYTTGDIKSFTEQITEQNSSNEVPTFNFMDISISNSLGGFSSCSFTLIVGRDVEPTIQMGDIVEITEGSTTLFLGYCATIKTTVDESGKYLGINCVHFLSRLHQTSYLAKLQEENPKAVQDQISIQRTLDSVFSLIRQGTLLECGNFYTDLPFEARYSGFFDTSISCGTVLDSVASTYIRHTITRRNGDLYVTQLFSSDTISRSPENDEYTAFNSYNYNDFLDRSSLSYTTEYNYENVPFTTKVLYSNSTILANGLISAFIYFYYKYPNPNTLYVNTETTQLFLSPSAGLSLLNSSVDVEVSKEVFGISPISTLVLGNDGAVKQEIYAAKLQLDLLRVMYAKVRNVEITSVSLNYTPETMNMDVGDTVLMPNGDLLTIRSIVITLNKPLIRLTLMPLLLTNPSVVPIQLPNDGNQLMPPVNRKPE